MEKGRNVLNRSAVEKMVQRMSYQVREQFMNFTELVIIGINGQGYVLAKQIEAHLRTMNAFPTTLYKLKLNKHQASKPTLSFEPPLPSLNGKPVLLVDDVLNSGRTLTYALSPLVEHAIPSLKIAVLVERTYRAFPVSASITGISLSTTFEEHVEAVLESANDEKGVFLS